jgi:hypothetical protein
MSALMTNAMVPFEMVVPNSTKWNAGRIEL